LIRFNLIPKNLSAFRYRQHGAVHEVGHPLPLLASSFLGLAMSLDGGFEEVEGFLRVGADAAPVRRSWQSAAPTGPSAPQPPRLAGQGDRDSGNGSFSAAS